jgi:tetratricopeptide (TPR) repeat protein
MSPGVVRAGIGLGFVTVEPETARGLCAVAEEALIEGAFCTGEFAEAERLFTEARAAAAQAGDREREARAVGGLGMARHYRSIARLVAGEPVAEADVAAEEELMRRALALWRETGDAAGTAMALFGVSLVFQVLRRDWDTGMRYLWQAVGLAEAVAESGDLYGGSEIHRHLGFYYLLEDIRPKEAVRQFGHSLELRERIGDPRLLPSALVVLGNAELAAGNPEQAVALLNRAVTVARQASLLPWRVQDAEDTLRKAEAAAQGRR